MRSGFVTLVGRPNVGKSSLVNAMVGEKVTIVSDKPQTTRLPVRGIRTTATSQMVFVDTPGFHRPQSALGERLNATVDDAIGGVDVVVIVFDIAGGVGRLDRTVAGMVSKSSICALNKVDMAKPAKIGEQLTIASPFDFAAYVPVSARSFVGIDALLGEIEKRLPEGPLLYPEEYVRDLPEPLFVAELVREQLLHRLREEVPHSVATRVTEWGARRIRVEIVVERDSQKGIVIGKGGTVLRDVGIAVRHQLPDGIYLDLAVVIDKDWQQQSERVERLLNPDLLMEAIDDIDT